MNLFDIKDLYGYDCWANLHMLDTAETVSPGQFTAHADHSHGSLRGTLVHTFDAEESWRTRMTEGHSTPDVLEEDFPDVASLRARWQTEQATMNAFIASLKDEDLGRTIRYTAGDQEYQRVLWHCIVHMIDHGTQHRSEAAAILTGFGRSPGDVHFMLWIREHRGR